VRALLAAGADGQSGLIEGKFVTAGRVLTVLVFAGVVGCAILIAAQDSKQGDKNEPAPPPAQDAPKPPRPRRVRLAQGVAEKFIVKKVPPKYPDEARAEHVQGTVLLRTEIGTDGNVESVELISGHPLLAPAAIDAVKQWKFKPFLLNRQPIAIETQMLISFTLSQR
jgi:TonB family protein